MGFDCLNNMINYIEENLDDKIDFNELSKITNTNIFILERIFMFFTNMTIVEYIKKRRLSKAFEDIRNTNLKIIDIAFKYQYNSASAFNRAFKSLFNITPTECRKGVGSYQIIPMMYFETDSKNYEFDYEIKEINTISLYCYHVTAKNYSDLLYKIRKLYSKIINNGYYKEFNEIGMYGIFFENEDSYNYYLGSTKYFSDLEKYELNKNKYAIFKLKSRKQNDIINFEKRLSRQWMPATNYDIDDNIKIELYLYDNCYIHLPIK